jgi:Holliday junction DNA helicase RuvA
MKGNKGGLLSGRVAGIVNYYDIVLFCIHYSTKVRLVMIGSLKGVIKSVGEQSILIEVGGIGFELLTPQTTLFQVGQQCELYTHLHFNAEQGNTLYGFATQAQKKVFLLIIGCSGIGPKIALAILASLKVSDFVRAVTSAEISILSSVSGIGPKKTEQLMLYLRHKSDQLLACMDTSEEGTVQDYFHEVSAALSSLRYSRTEIAKALAHLRTTSVQATSTDQLLRQALLFLAKQ